MRKAWITVEESGVRSWLRSSEQITIGGSALGPLEIGDPEMADPHFHVRITGECCELQCCPGNLVRLNGDLVAFAELQDGDRLVAGNTSFLVTLSPKQTSFPEPETQPEAPFEYRWSPLPSKVHLFSSDQPLQEPRRLLEALHRGRNAFLMAGKPFVANGAATNPVVHDFFDAVDPEYRQQEALLLLDFQSSDELIEEYCRWRQQDAVLIILTSMSRDQLIEAMRFHFAWFLRPSLFHFHMTQNNRQLVEQVFQAVDLVFGESVAEWWVFGSPKTIHSWQDTGLETAPMG